jgi:hypothetical protein
MMKINWIKNCIDRATYFWLIMNFLVDFTQGRVKKLKNQENWKKNNWKNRTVKKNRLNQLKFWKNRPVQFGFGFISLKPKKPNWIEKTEPNWKKPSQIKKNRKNRAKPVWTSFCPKKLNRTETGRFEPVSVFFFKFSLVTFFW